jgi:hypothetical protein
VPVLRALLPRAMDSALLTSDQARWVSIDAPATLLECASSTTQQQTLSLIAQCSEMSVTDR